MMPRYTTHMFGILYSGIYAVRLIVVLATMNAVLLSADIFHISPTNSAQPYSRSRCHSSLCTAAPTKMPTAIHPRHEYHAAVHHTQVCNTLRMLLYQGLMCTQEYTLDALNALSRGKHILYMVTNSTALQPTTAYATAVYVQQHQVGCPCHMTAVAMKNYKIMQQQQGSGEEGGERGYHFDDSLHQRGRERFA